MLSDVGFCKPFIKRQLHIHRRSPAECVWGGEIHALREIRRTGDACLRFLTERRDYLQSSEDPFLIFIVISFIQDLFCGFVWLPSASFVQHLSGIFRIASNTRDF